MNEEYVKPALPDLLSLEGKRALVTGGSGNIGRGIALRLAEAGADVIVHYHADRGGADETLAVLKKAGRQAVAVQADLGNAGEVAETFRKLGESGKPVTSVVNNAGTYPVQAFVDISGEEWRRVMSANLDSAAYVSREAIRGWRDNGMQGVIVNVASIEASDPAAGHSHYAASKAGLLMLTRSLALENGRSGIRVNAVSPGLIARQGIEQNWPEGVASWLEHVPLASLGDCTDVADAVLFLLAPASRWITGVNLVVDGGMSCVPRW